MGLAVETAVKCTAAVETGFQSNICDRRIGGEQEQLCFVYPLLCYILRKGHTYKIPEQPGKVKF